MLVLINAYTEGDQEHHQQLAAEFYANILAQHQGQDSLDGAISAHTRTALYSYAKNLMLAHPGHVKTALTAHEVEMSVQMASDGTAQYRQHMVDMYLESGTFPAALVQTLSQADGLLSEEMTIAIIDVLVAAALKMFPEDHTLVDKGAILASVARYLELRKEMKSDAIQGYFRRTD